MTDRFVRCVVLAALVLALLNVWIQPLQAEVVSGVVFLDTNGNRARDPGEEGVAGVAVSDGIRVVQTDGSGRYRLDAQRDPLDTRGARPVVSVSFPSGTWPTGPWFRRLADEKDAKALDFGLRTQRQKTPFYFVHATDTHVPRGGKDRIVTFGRELGDLGLPVAFAAITGDLTNLSDSASPDQAESDFRLYERATSRFPLPVFSVPGNHDCSGIRTSRGWADSDWRHGYGLYRKHVGPLRWSFNYAGYHMVGLDFNRKTDGKWSWGVPAEAVAWLRRDLALRAKGTPVLLFVHHPAGDAGLLTAIQELKITHIFSGHGHSVHPYTVAGRPGNQSGSVAQMHGDRHVGYAVVQVGDKGVSCFYKELGDPYAVMLETPRVGSTLKKSALLKGAFFDPRGRVHRLVVTVGDAKPLRRPLAFRRSALCCRFEAELDLSDLPRGFQPLRLSMQDKDGKELGAWSRSYLMLTGRQGVFRAAGPAELVLDVAGIDVSAAVRLNGQRLRDLAPTKLKGDSLRRPVRGADRIVIPIPAERLRRLNVVEVSAGKHPSGKTDVLYLVDVRMRYEGREARDLRMPGGPYFAREVTGEITRYMDLVTK